MIPTLFGLIILVIGLVLLVGARPPAMFALVLICGLMSGSASFILTALGGSSIPPAHFALGFLVLRLFLPGSGQRPLVTEAIRANGALVAYALYGVLIGYVGPRLFAGAIQVAPMRINALYIYATQPLMPTSQNVTTSIYLIGTALAAIGAYVVARNPVGPTRIVKTGVVIAWIHMMFGIASVMLQNTPGAAFLDFFRNGSYAQLDQSYGGLVRMNGIMAEPSSFAGFGLGWFIFLFECWYRDVLPRRTGPTALALGVTLLASTSSTAYVGLSGYAALLTMRTLFVPVGVAPAKFIKLAAALLVLTVAVSAIFILHPALASMFGDMIVAMTVDKQGSKSGLQRAFWAAQGLRAFPISWGLGIGPGSFRSSSLPAAIAGSVGIVGAIAFTIHLLRTVKPLRQSTYTRDGGTEARIGVAASWTALATLLPAAVSAPSCDPGTDFAVMTGIALALRRAPRPERRAAPAPRSDVPRYAPAGAALRSATGLGETS